MQNQFHADAVADGSLWFLEEPMQTQYQVSHVSSEIVTVVVQALPMRVPSQTNQGTACIHVTPNTKHVCNTAHKHVPWSAD